MKLDFSISTKQNLKHNTMNKKIIAGAVIALAAGVAAFIYKRNRNKINEAAANAYDTVNEGINYAEEKADNIFS